MCLLFQGKYQKLLDLRDCGCFFGCVTKVWSSGTNTMWVCNNAAKCLQNPHNRHPIADAYGLAMLLFGSLTHWGRVMHIWVGNLTIIASDSGLSPGRRQAIFWTNAGILLIGPLEQKILEIWMEILTFSFKKIHFKFNCRLRNSGHFASVSAVLNSISCHIWLLYNGTLRYQHFYGFGAYCLWTKFQHHYKCIISSIRNWYIQILAWCTK